MDQNLLNNCYDYRLSCKCQTFAGSTFYNVMLLFSLLYIVIMWATLNMFWF